MKRTQSLTKTCLRIFGELEPTEINLRGEKKPLGKEREVNLTVYLIKNIFSQA
jgi:hypothetical protein